MDDHFDLLLVGAVVLFILFKGGLGNSNVTALQQAQLSSTEDLGFASDAASVANNLIGIWS